MMTSFSSSTTTTSLRHSRANPATLITLARLEDHGNTPLRTISLFSPQYSRPLNLPIKIQPLSLSHPYSPFYSQPISSFPKISCSQKSESDNSPQKKPTLLRTLAGGLALVLVGSLLFSGRFKRGPSDATKSGFSSTMEEKRSTQNKNDDGEASFEKILESNPRDVAALRVVLFGKMRGGKVEEAVEYVERLIALQPEEMEWRLLRALSYELMGKLDMAKRFFIEILEERPLMLRALHGLALAMHKNREGPAIFEMLNKALELAHRENRVTEERNIKILIAQMHVVKGDLEEASKQFKDLQNEDPRDFRPYLCQGIVYSLLDRKSEADEQFEIYRSLIPEEFPNRSFIDDAILAAKTESQEQLQKEFKSSHS